MESLRRFARFGRIAFVLALAPLRYVGRLLVEETSGDDSQDARARRREHLQGDVLARSLESLGATFVKFGQILGSRADLLPHGWIAPLVRLQDDVAPTPFDELERVVAEELPEGARARLSHVERTPVAAASVAQVHRGRLDTGELVALKIQRPSARVELERDLFLLERIAQGLEHIPTLRLLSIGEAMARFGAALRAQLDFTLEAANNRRLAANFRRERGVRVPRLYDELCTARVLTMEFVEGVRATEPERVGGDRRQLAERGGRAILKMVFEDGFVHADLHPGNILLSDDGTLTFLDLGMVAEIPPDLMRPWISTFLALARRDAVEAARLFYVHAPSVGTDDYAAYERDVVAFLAPFWDAKLGDIEVGVVVSGTMNVLRRHRVQIEPVFTVVNLALLVAEGLGKQLDPDIDLVQLAVPYLLAAQLGAPPGRPPLRLSTSGGI